MKTIAEAFLKDDDLFATSALAILIDNFGAESLNWENETINMELHRHGVVVKPAVWDRLQAAITILTTDMVYRDALVFNNVMRALSFDDVNPASYVPVSLSDIMWGCTEMRLLEGAEDWSPDNFSDDIKLYIGRILLQHGLTDAPDIIKFATIPQREADNRDANLGSNDLLFQNYWDNQKEVIKESLSFVSTQTTKLLDQLKSLPLKNVDEKFIADVEGINKTASEAKTKVVGKGTAKQTIANKPLPQGSDLGKVIQERTLVTPAGEVNAVQDVKRFARYIANANPGNTNIQANKQGVPHMIASQPINYGDAISTNINNQNVLPKNINSIADTI